jgi:hypothetical protein
MKLKEYLKQQFMNSGYDEFWSESRANFLANENHTPQEDIIVLKNDMYLSTDGMTSLSLAINGDGRYGLLLNEHWYGIEDMLGVSEAIYKHKKMLTNFGFEKQTLYRSSDQAYVLKISRNHDDIYGLELDEDWLKIEDWFGISDIIQEYKEILQIYWQKNIIWKENEEND